MENFFVADGVKFNYEPTIFPRSSFSEAAYLYLTHIFQSVETLDSSNAVNKTHAVTLLLDAVIIILIRVS